MCAGVCYTAESQGGGLEMVCKEYVKNTPPLLLSHSNTHKANIKTGNIFQTKSNLTCVESGTARDASKLAAFRRMFV